MTNENMIKQLKRLIPSLEYADDVNAVKGAIKALSQEPICPSAGIDCKDCPADDAINRILTKMWNCRGKHTTSIDKVAMEQIIRDELSSVTSKPIECDDTVSRGVFEQVRWERDIAIEQLHELGYEWGQKIEPLEVETAKLQQAYDKGFEDCRQAMLDYLKANVDDFPDYHEAIEKVLQMPPVTPQQKTGHWIHFAQSDDCSECGWSTGKYISPSNYCPNCGCRMVEPQESEVRNEV